MLVCIRWTVEAFKMLYLMKYINKNSIYRPSVHIHIYLYVSVFMFMNSDYYIECILPSVEESSWETSHVDN